MKIDGLEWEVPEDCDSDAAMTCVVDGVLVESTADGPPWLVISRKNFSAPRGFIAALTASEVACKKEELSAAARRVADRINKARDAMLKESLIELY